MSKAKNGFELLLDLIREDEEMLQSLFLENGQIAKPMVTMFCWEDWPEEKREIVQRLARRELVKIQYRHPVNEEFSSWLIACKSEPKNSPQELERLKEEYLGIEGFTVLLITEEGIKFLKK